MNMSVWKFSLYAAHSTTFEMPVGAKVLRCGAQGNSICLWVYCDTNPEVTKHKRKFCVLGTGHEAPDPEDIIAFIPGHATLPGPFVFHVIEVSP